MLFSLLNPNKAALVYLSHYMFNVLSPLDCKHQEDGDHIVESSTAAQYLYHLEHFLAGSNYLFC